MRTIEIDQSKKENYINILLTNKINVAILAKMENSTMKELLPGISLGDVITLKNTAKDMNSIQKPNDNVPSSPIQIEPKSPLTIYFIDIIYFYILKNSSSIVANAFKSWTKNANFLKLSEKKK